MLNAVNVSATDLSLNSGLRFSPDEATQKSLGYYRTESRPGESKTFKFFVSNVSTETKHFIIQPTDVLTGIGGAMQATSPGDQQKAVGTWFSNEPISVDLSPGKTESFDFTLKVPEKIEDGQYIGGIVMHPDAIISGGGDGGINTASVQAKISTPVLIQTVIDINIKNATEVLSLPDPSIENYPDGRTKISLPFQNDGTILVRPKGKFEMFNSKDELIESKNISMERVYVGTTGLYIIEPTVFLDAGGYTLKYNAKFGEQNIEKIYKFTITKEHENLSKEQLQDSGKLEVNIHNDGVPWKFVIGGTAIMFIALFYLLLLLLKKNKKKKDENRDIAF